MTISLYHINAFTNVPLGAGNTAAVCLLNGPAEEHWMLQLAAELKHSETAYVQAVRDSDNEFELRWFTPKVEMDLCGHATLASAFVLWEAGKVAKDKTIIFHTRSGELEAKYRGEKIELNFPLIEVVETTADDSLAQALKLPFKFVGKAKDNLFVELESEQQLVELSPDFSLLAKIPVHGFIVTAQSQQTGVDFVSRFFAPSIGVDEDPVTGSAHCALAFYWRQKLAKDCFQAKQLSPRGGELEVQIEDQRVLLRGQATALFKGELYE